jgi:Flp pilus assembly pilin Flp
MRVEGRRQPRTADDSPSLAEIALIIALIAIVSIAGLIALGGQISSTLVTVSKPV